MDAYLDDRGDRKVGKLCQSSSAVCLAEPDQHKTAQQCLAVHLNRLQDEVAVPAVQQCEGIIRATTGAVADACASADCWRTE